MIGAEEERILRGDLAAGAAAGSRNTADIEVLREMLLRLEVRTHEAGELRARLQITERAESTLREDLERERERADQERLRSSRNSSSRRSDRPRSWWRRFFGSR